MAPIKRSKGAGRSAPSAKKRKLSTTTKKKPASSSLTSAKNGADAKPFTPGELTSSKRHKNKKSASEGSNALALSTALGVNTSKNRVRKPQKKALIDRYTDSQLKLPTLNGIIPSGVTKPRGKKKGKVFVEDKETMMGILEVVNESVDGVIQGKVEKNRRLEVIREQKRLEQERKDRAKESKLEDAKESLRKKRRRKDKEVVDNEAEEEETPAPSKKNRKKVVFA